MTSDSPDSHPEPKLRIRSLYKSFTAGVKREHVLAGVHAHGLLYFGLGFADGVAGDGLGMFAVQ